MLARKYNSQDIKGWVMSEKFDGVRAIWDGENFVSRNGNVFPFPYSVTSQMPTGVILDGELFAGRGRFQDSVSKVKTGDMNGLQFMVFDLISKDVFSSRAKNMSKVELPYFCTLVEHVKCTSEKKAFIFEADIVANGGEGVMLCNPNSLYIHARSANLLKIKSFSDSEAVVVGYKDGKGKHAGACGALEMEMNGAHFKIGTGLTDELRANPPEVGSVVTFSHFGFTNSGAPRHASFICVRDYE